MFRGAVKAEQTRLEEQDKKEEEKVKEMSPEAKALYSKLKVSFCEQKKASFFPKKANSTR